MVIKLGLDHLLVNVVDTFMICQVKLELHILSLEVKVSTSLIFVKHLI